MTAQATRTSSCAHRLHHAASPLPHPRLKLSRLHAQPQGVKPRITRHSTRQVRGRPQRPGQPPAAVPIPESMDGACCRTWETVELNGHLCAGMARPQEYNARVVKEGERMKEVSSRTRNRHVLRCAHQGLRVRASACAARNSAASASSSGSLAARLSATCRYCIF